jgi:peroxiredoxin
MDTSHLECLPDHLPVPEDDRAASHLTGCDIPVIALPSTEGTMLELSSLQRVTLVYVYPKTGHPGSPLPDGWDEIAGARGCTPESCGFRDHFSELQALHVDVFGLSTQATDYQQEARERLHLPFHLLSDSALALKAALSLPTFTIAGEEFYKRLTLVIAQGLIQHVFYPVFPPDKHAGVVLAWLRNQS